MIEELLNRLENYELTTYEEISEEYKNGLKELQSNISKMNNEQLKRMKSLMYKYLEALSIGFSKKMSL